MTRRGMNLRVLVVALGLASQAFGQQPPDASAKAEARQNAIDGQNAFDSGDYPTAAYRLGLAYEVAKVPTVGLRYARALIKIGQLREAEARLQQVVAFDVTRAAADQSLQSSAQQEARQELAALSPRIPRLAITLRATNVAGVEVTIDGGVVPPALWSAAPVNPGKRVVQARRGADVLASQEVVATEARSEPVSLVLWEVAPVQPPLAAPLPPPGVQPPVQQTAAPQPLLPPAPPPAETQRTSPLRTWAWVSYGVGAVGLAAGAVTGTMALLKKKDLDASGDCSSNQCTASQRDEMKAYNSLLPICTAGLVVGAVGIGVGTTLLLAEPKGENPGLTATIGLGSASVQGTF
jgi:hypothetical protein